MKAFLWSLCLHIVLLGLLTYHHFAPTEAAKLKSEPPILAYAYQPIKPAALVQIPVAAEPVKTAVPQPAVKAAQKPPSRVQHKKAPAVKAQSQKPKPQKTRLQKAKPQQTKAKTVVVQPQRRPFVPVRKPAMVKPPPVVAKPIPLPAPKQPAVAATAKPLPVPKPVELNPVKVIETAKVAEVKVNSKAVQQEVRQGSSAVVSGALDHGKTIASKALQSARQGDSSGSATWKEKQKQLALEITITKAEQKPEVGRKVKTFADGSSLIDTNPGCWRVPPPESRKDSIWLSTSIPCKPDTTVEQINDILQKRRSYSRD